VILRRSGLPAADNVSVSLPLPLTARVGIRYLQLRDKREVFDLELDVGYECWSRAKRFSLDSHGLVAHLLGQRMDVGTIEIDKQWRDTVSLELGGDYALITDWLTLRSGVFYETAVADRSHAHADFVSRQQLGAAGGASVFYQGSELALAYGYRHQPTVRVTEGEARVFQEGPGSQCQEPYTDPETCHQQYLGRPAPPVNAGTYRAHSHVVSLGWLCRF
jgi:long-subunit fatty acid transport protein